MIKGQSLKIKPKETVQFRRQQVVCGFFDALSKETDHYIQHCHGGVEPKEWLVTGVDGCFDNKDDVKMAFKFIFMTDDTTAIERQLNTLMDDGYFVIYAWEDEYLKRANDVPVHKICRTFNGQLVQSSTSTKRI